MSDALDFLTWLRPGGPWLLTAIVPDGDTETKTCCNEAEVKAFVAEHDGKRNIYYTANPTKRAMSKKPEKGDIAAAEFIHGDLDPEGNETPEQRRHESLKQ
jgi:Mesyanzhinovviridae DNA primase